MTCNLLSSGKSESLGRIAAAAGDASMEMLLSIPRPLMVPLIGFVTVADARAAAVSLLAELQADMGDMQGLELLAKRRRDPDEDDLEDEDEDDLEDDDDDDEDDEDDDFDTEDDLDDDFEDDDMDDEDDIFYEEDEDE